MTSWSCSTTTASTITNSSSSSSIQLERDSPAGYLGVWVGVMAQPSIGLPEVVKHVLHAIPASTRAV
eukprot:1146191-Pelagomonas_calceolata.AAC.1